MKPKGEWGGAWEGGAWEVAYEGCGLGCGLGVVCACSQSDATWGGGAWGVWLEGVELEGWSLSPTEGIPEMEASPPEVGFPTPELTSEDGCPCVNDVEAPIISKLD